MLFLLSQFVCLRPGKTRLKNISLVVASYTVGWRTVVTVAINTLAHFERFDLFDLLHRRNVSVAS